MNRINTGQINNYTVKTREKKDYYIRLDIIRIISCIMVLLYHLDIVKGGFLAVCTFFTLSRIFNLYICFEKR